MGQLKNGMHERGYYFESTAGNGGEWVRVEDGAVLRLADQLEPGDIIAPEELAAQFDAYPFGEFEGAVMDDSVRRISSNGYGVVQSAAPVSDTSLVELKTTVGDARVNRLTSLGVLRMAALSEAFE